MKELFQGSPTNGKLKLLADHSYLVLFSKRLSHRQDKIQANKEISLVYERIHHLTLAFSRDSHLLQQQQPLPPKKEKKTRM